MMDANLQAAAEAAVAELWNFDGPGKVIQDEGEIAIIARHLAAYAEAVVEKNKQAFVDAGLGAIDKIREAAQQAESIDFQIRAKSIEDAARAVVDDYEKQVAICDTGAMVWAKRRLLDALAEALEGEKHE